MWFLCVAKLIKIVVVQSQELSTYAGHHQEGMIEKRKLCLKNYIVSLFLNVFIFWQTKLNAASHVTSMC